MSLIARRALVPCICLALLAGVVPPALGQTEPLHQATGNIAGMNPAGGFGVTDGEFLVTCAAPPESQGVDGYIFELPETIPAGSIATVAGQSTIDHDLDVVVYDRNCKVITVRATADADETVTLPPGSRFLSAIAFTGLDTEVTLTVQSGPPLPPDPVVGELIDGPRRTRDYPTSPNDPYFDADGGLGDADPQDPPSVLDAFFDEIASPQQWAPKKILAPQAWQEQRATGARVGVAVLDTGLDIGHPDLSCPGKVALDPTFDVVRDGNGPTDMNGHGTHVAGIIGACTNNGTGVAGVAPDAQILPIQVFSSDADYDGDADDNGRDDLADAIRLAADAGAHVVNMSLGFAFPIPGGGAIGYAHNAGFDRFGIIPPEIITALEYAQSKGTVIVAAAGNDTTLPICDYPAAAKNVICVGATDPRDQRTWYTNGANKVDFQGNIGPAVVAPGGTETVAFCDIYHENVLSTYSRALDDIPCGIETGYQTINGTSMASPHVAGIAALIYDRIGAVRDADNAARVIEAIVNSADDLGSPGYDPIYAFGRVNAQAAATYWDAEPFDTMTSFTEAASGRVAVQVLDEDDYPVVGESVAFQVGDQAGVATTDDEGIATFTFTLPPGDYMVSATFGGVEGLYDPSSATTALASE